MIDLIENPPLLTALPDPYILEMETKDKGAFGRGFRLLAWEGGCLMEQKFFICEHCGNIIAMVKSSGVPVMCCGQQMKEIIPGTTDAAVEKHVPVYTVEGNKVMVTVGSAEHPMLPEHYIEWVSLQTKQGNQRKALKPGDAPKVCFAICEGDEVEAVYAYCNLHSLWKA